MLIMICKSVVPNDLQTQHSSHSFLMEECEECEERRVLNMNYCSKTSFILVFFENSNEKNKLYQKDTKKKNDISEKVANNRQQLHKNRMETLKKKSFCNMKS